MILLGLTEAEKKEKKKNSNRKQYQKNRIDILQSLQLKRDLTSGMKRTTFDPKLEKSEKTIEERFDEYAEQSVLSIGYNEGSLQYDNDVIIYPMGDLHIGSEHVRYRDVLNRAKLVRDTPHLYTILMGDYADNFHKYSPGGGMWEQLMPPAKAVKEVLNLIDIMKDKVIGVIAGCHDLWDFNISGKKFAREIADRCTDAYWLGPNGYLNMNIGPQEYRIYASHKFRGGSKWNICHGIMNHCREIGDFDLGIGAHRHQPGIFRPFYKGREIVCMRITSFKVTDTHIKTKGYADSPVASPTAILRTKRKTIDAYMHLDDAIERL